MQTTDEGDLIIFTVCYDTRDFPGLYTCRGHAVKSGSSVPQDNVLVCPELGPIRNEMVRLGLTRMPRQEDDDPVIVESWL